ncbi:MAG: GNAT family N-acetyltransferase [Pseudomonadota bacterium]|nr:GNAT family N-acetyltransferase [Pseudomonadota bacterium]
MSLVTDTPFAETERLLLRALKETDLPRLVELIGEWDVVRWLVQLPHPYILKHAQEFHNRMAECHRQGAAEYFVIASRADKGLMGAVGLHPSRTEPRPGELVLGYWLGKPFWGQGFMTEAVAATIALAFASDENKTILSTTDPANEASQKVLRKAGFTYLGLEQRADEVVRGSQKVARWRLDNPRCPPPPSSAVRGDTES